MTLHYRRAQRRTLFSISLVVVLLAAMGTPACNHQSTTAKPQPEPSAGTGLTRPSDTSTANAPSSSIEVRPFLLQPELGSIRQALEVEDYEAGYAALRSMMGPGRVYADDCLECWYLLGILAERQGDLAKANVAFETASAREWPLRDDAALHSISLKLAQNHCAQADAALTVLTSHPAAGTDPSELARLMIDVDSCAKRFDSAISKLRASIGSVPDQCRKAASELQLGRLLVEQAAGSARDANAARHEAIELARDARASCPVDPIAAANQSEWFSRLVESSAAFEKSRELLTEQIYVLESFVETRRWELARQKVEELLGSWGETAEVSQLRCRVVFSEARIAVGLSERKRAVERFAWVAQHCSDDDLVPRALFLGAGQLVALGQTTQAIAAYAELEQRFAQHRLADDARLKRAVLYRGLGSESRFIELLDAMPEDYPDGDMVLEALFQLALRSMVQRDWLTAHATLERAARYTPKQPKHVELDRQEYFLAKAKLQLGQTDLAIPRFRALITNRPLSYYMLLAFSELGRKDVAVATQIVDSLAHSNSADKPWTGDLDQTERERAAQLMAVLGVGDVRRAEARLRALGEPRKYQTMVTRIADMFVQVGAPKTALSLVSSVGFDWRVKWPSAGWIDYWQQAYPRPYRHLVRQAAQATGVDESLIYAIMREESEFDPAVVSRAAAIGLMQLIIPTAKLAARDLGIRVDEPALKKPANNIAIGSRVLAQLASRFHKQIPLIAAGYNAGPGRPTRWLRNDPDVDLDLWVELIEFPETRGYVKRVVESEAVYHWLYGAETSEKLRALPRRLESTSNASPVPAR
jgi:soluble lytic murein transglycosylase